MIYLTYNPRNKYEQTAALRTQTIGSLHGISIYLPDRIGLNAKSDVKETTKERIDKSDLFIAFSLGKPSKYLQKEISFAAERNKISVIVYGFKKKEKPHGSAGKIMEMHADFSRGMPVRLLDQIQTRVLTIIQGQQAGKKRKLVYSKGIDAVWTAGVCLFILYHLNRERGLLSS